MKKESMEDYNREVYELASIVEWYSRITNIYKPEETIIKILEPELKKMSMLDIGIGAGRTALHFGPLVKEYIAIDYSLKMIERCKKRFSRLNENYVFKVCDARNMSCFEDNYFDFILFSANGIDYMSHEGRLIALAEISRVAKNGAFLCFSSHNILSLDALFRFRFRFKIWKAMKRYFLLRSLNGNHKKIMRQDYAILIDVLHDFKNKTYYIDPNFQIKQLIEHGFKNICVFSLYTGEEIKSNLSLANDLWLHYLCRVDK